MFTDRQQEALSGIDRIDAALRCCAVGCAAPTYVTDMWTWPSSDGRIHHARTRCEQGHVFTLPTDWLLTTAA